MINIPRIAIIMKGSIFFLNNIANIGLVETRMVDEAIVVRNTLETKNNM
jgi:hypothetical protein